MTVTLSTLGSRGVTLDVAPSALSEAGAGGVQVTLGLFDGPLTVTFTAGEALAFCEELRAVLLSDVGP